MKINAVTGHFEILNLDTLIVFQPEDSSSIVEEVKDIDTSLDGSLTNLIKTSEIKGEFGEITHIHTFGKLTASRVLVIGIGNQDDFTHNKLRELFGITSRYLSKTKASEIGVLTPRVNHLTFEPKLLGQSVTEGIILGLYKFDKYVSSNPKTSFINQIQLISNTTAEMQLINLGIKQGRIIAEASNLCRDMVNEPANHMSPTNLAEIATKVAKDTNIDVKILDQPEMEKYGMGALLGVAKGSTEPPKFIILQYWGDPNNKDENLGLIGKGITFDTGGISLKPAPGMEEMKTDMAGGASVIAAIKAIALLKPKINVTAIVPATENMPSGTAQRPGDVVTAMNGKTIEVDNTDAEGRLALADAISYARSELNLTKIVDVATLTGAIVIALGHTYTGAFSNNQDLLQIVIEAGLDSGELIWQLPLHKDYKEQNKSDVADMKNTGGRPAGSITAAHFIAEFSEDTPWVHLDIAGTARSSKVKGYIPKGASGIPVRTLVNLALKLST